MSGPNRRSASAMPASHLPIGPVPAPRTIEEHVVPTDGKPVRAKEARLGSLLHLRSAGYILRREAVIAIAEAYCGKGVVDLRVLCEGDDSLLTSEGLERFLTRDKERVFVLGEMALELLGRRAQAMLQKRHKPIAAWEGFDALDAKIRAGAYLPPAPPAPRPEAPAPLKARVSVPCPPPAPMPASAANSQGSATVN